MHLPDAAWTDVAALETDLALVPVGSHEQHGPHLPLGTDALIAGAVAEAAAGTYPADVLVAPTLPLGIAEEHRTFDGTLWTSPDVFRETVRSVLSSLAHHGFDRAVIVNGHGGNTDALREVSAAHSRSGTGYAVSVTWFDAIDLPQPMGHAGPVETAMMRHHHPELVDEDAVPAAAADGADRWGEWVRGTNLAHDSDEFTENGVVGDPTAGDAALGLELTERAGEAVSDVLSAVADRGGPD